MASNFAEEDIHSYVAAIQHAGLSVFSISLSTAGLRLSGDGSLFGRRGNHGRAQGPGDDAHGGGELHVNEVCM